MSHDRRRTAAQRGFLEVEIIIVGILILVMSAAVALMVVRAQRAQGYLERSALVTNAAQSVLESIRSAVSSSARIFHADAQGQAYLAGLDRSTVAGLDSVRLPIVDSDGIFKTDQTGNEITGNLLLFAKHDRTDSFDVGSGPPELVRVNVYRLHAYYLRRIPGKDIHAEVDSLDLVSWVSEPLVDRDQAMQIPDPAKRAALLAHLYAGTNPVEPQYPYPAARLLWRIGDGFSTAFARINADGSTSGVSVSFKVPMDEQRSRPDQLEYRKLAVTSNVAGSDRGVPAFGLIDNANDGFPHGFEVQVIGPASARQVLIRLTLVSGHQGAERAWMTVQSLADARDL